jgi:hypothetical protein
LQGLTHLQLSLNLPLGRCVVMWHVWCMRIQCLMLVVLMLPLGICVRASPAG